MRAKDTSSKAALYLGWAGSETSELVLDILTDHFEVSFARRCSFGDHLDQEDLAKLRADFLFSFGPVIVRSVLLESVRVAAINFHTGPPKWPGRGSCSFALWDGDKEFGVTAHLMENAVDSGAILRVVRFPIESGDSAETLHEKALRSVPKLVELVVADLESNNWRPVPGEERWERAAMRQRDLVRTMQVEDTDSAVTVSNKIRAFAHSSKPGPYVDRHGFRFWYLGDSRGET
jgi:methionyl-tRNA formyltransferase